MNEKYHMPSTFNFSANNKKDNNNDNNNNSDDNDNNDSDEYNVNNIRNNEYSDLSDNNSIQLYTNGTLLSELLFNFLGRAESTKSLYAILNYTSKNLAHNMFANSDFLSSSNKNLQEDKDSSIISNKLL
jgi:hypothetical protein